MFYLTGIIITFFLAIILISKRNKSEADHILAIWLVFLGFHLTLFYLVFAGRYIYFPYLLAIEIPLPLVHGPLLYLYTSSLTNQKDNKNYRLLHFIPAVIVYLSLIPFYTLPAIQKIFVYSHHGLGFETLLSWTWFVIVLSGIIYTALSLIKLYRHRKSISNEFSNTEKINLSWLMYLISGLIIIWFAVIFGTDKYIFAVVVLFVFFIGYFGIKQVGIFTSREEQNNKIADHQEIVQITTVITDKKSKYAKSGLNNDTATNIHHQLCMLMQEERLYTDPELTLSQVSQKLAIHPNSLSQVINSIEQKSFYDYINTQRVEEFKRIVCLPENQKFTLLSLAFECGFNSKTSFNRNFKKYAGLAPSEYIATKNITLQ